MRRFAALEALQQQFAADPELLLFNDAAELARCSKDAYDYSPVLIPQLSGCAAQLVARPRTVEAVERLAAACTTLAVPLTVRGAGTGNYGQCVPLDGGVVMQSSALNRIRAIDPETGVACVESGCLMRDLDRELRRHGRQLRLLPSTWRSATIGGFFAGGSGGIGSVRWGFLRDPGHLLGLELVPMQHDARRVALGEAEAEAHNHAYGTNGIITALTLATAPAVNWHQLSIDCSSWSVAVQLIQTIAASAVSLQLVTLLERPLMDHLPRWSGPDANAEHRILVLAAPDALGSLRRMAVAAGASFHDLGAENLDAGAGLRELSWNHTTLHMRASDPGWTYLQMLLPQPELPAMQALKQRWGDDLLWHIELVKQRGAVRMAALPLVRWRGPQALQDLMDHCRDLGALVFNPHVITVEDGGLGVIDADQVAAKQRFDPSGLLNPGKLRGWSAASPSA